MKLHYRITNTLFRIINPFFWIQNVSSCPYLDDFINESLDKGEIKILCGYYAEIGGKRIWIRNFPYRFGENQSTNTIPFPLTRLRLRKELSKLLYK